MNRLIIVGNGFDLAHGLPTGYCDFIDWYWRGVFNSFKNPYQYTFNYEDKLIKFNIDIFNLPVQIVEGFKTINNHLEYIEFVQSCSKLNIDTESFDYIDFTKNPFFQIINNQRHIQNWVDIENEYYRLLKDCLKEENDNSRVKKLNEEFEQVKKLFETYLNEEVMEKFNFKYKEALLDIASIFKINTFNLNEFSANDHEDLIKFESKFLKAKSDNNLKKEISIGNITQTNLFLNFNYTKTIEVYVDAINLNLGLNNYGETSEIQIHGKLNDRDNEINFGFGDEMDNHYKLIEEKGDNEYLKNIKSFQYLQNSNYRKMLDFIDSGNFQVYIMGHSCGLSDRILLNKIFEHDNCRSIKVFYHEFDKPKADGRTDNYTEIVQNISRHFNKKEMMREKIVNKSLCKPLPQTIRFAKKENGSQL